MTEVRIQNVHNQRSAVLPVVRVPGSGTCPQAPLRSKENRTFTSMNANVSGGALLRSVC